MKISTHTALSYDDVLIKPKFSEIAPSGVSTKTKFSRRIHIDIPIASAAMDTVTDGSMAKEMSRLGGIGVIHKNYSIINHAKEMMIAKEGNPKAVAAAVGVGELEEKRSEALVNAGADALVIDTAHGHSQGVISMLETLRSRYEHVDIIAGNVATLEACKALVGSGADAVKIGIGPGSICTTRIVAGIGVPQFQALVDCTEFMRSAGIPFIADGGIRFSGDIVKALGAGAHCVMLGSLLASTDQSASENVYIDQKTFKRYRGMGSLTAMNLGSKDRYNQGDVSTEKKLVPEGIEGLIPSRGALEDFLYQLVGGLRSGMGYVGAKNLNDLHEKVEFVRISNSSLKENHPHNITIDIGAPNYTSHS